MISRAAKTVWLEGGFEQKNGRDQLVVRGAGIRVSRTVREIWA